jgi:hypothetical protein
MNGKWKSGLIPSSSARSAPFPCPCTLRTRSQRWGLSFGSIANIISLSFYPIPFLSPSHFLPPPILHPRTRQHNNHGRIGKHTFKYSLVASWYSLFIVPGDPLANILIATNTASETPTPSTVYPATFQPSPGGVWARGPWAPNAM